MDKWKTKFLCILIIALCVSCTGAERGSILPTPTDPPTTVESAGIDGQIEETLQAVRRQVIEIKDPILKTETEQKIQPLIDATLQEVEYERKNGATSTNSAGEQVFVGESAEKFDSMLKNLKLQAEGMVKWAGFTGRSTEERKGAEMLVTEITGSAVTYIGYRPFAYNLLQMVEWYQSAGVIYEVDIETGRIVHFSPESDTLPAQGVTVLMDRADYKIKSEALIHQLAPDIDLEKLSLRDEAADSPYFHWEDLQAARLLSGDFPFVEVVWKFDGLVYSFTNTIH